MIDMKELFELRTPKSKGHCKDCKHRQPTQCGNKVIQYCKVWSSNRTYNGLKKIKVYMTCEGFTNKKEMDNE